ncbi:MAG: molecular chaperone SurA [Rhodocyclaceae bacterium]|nr:MAG: molecular chaperone SurA [Rhodocyclaceae bacterium]
MKPITMLLISVAFMATGAAAQGTRPPSVVKPIEVDRIIAVVNEEAITLHELSSRLFVVERQLKAQGTQLPPREVLEKQLLERLIIDRVQIQMAKDTGTRVDDTQLDAALRRIADGNRLTMGEFRAALEKDGIAWAKFREEVRDEMTIARLREREVENRISVSDGEIDNYLANPESSAAANEELHLAHILLRLPEQANPTQLLRIRGRAEQALEQLKKGEDFAKVAASYSDATDALSGGSIGLRPLDRLPSLYADAAQNLKPGEISGILRSPAGFHIIKVIERRGGARMPQSLRQTLARHILIKINELVPEVEALRKARGLKERLDNGADFAELARLNSNDASASKGGDLGWLFQGDTVPDFESAMDGLKIKETSQPVKTQFGYHLIQVLERRVEDVSQERKRQVARQVLRERKADEEYQEWLRQIRDRAYVEYRVEER